MFSGFSKLISDELTQFDINNLTSFDDLQNTLDPTLVVEDKKAVKEEGQLDVIAEIPVDDAADLSNEKSSGTVPEGAADSARAESRQGQPVVETSRPTVSQTADTSSASSGADFFRSFEVSAGFSGTSSATDSTKDEGGDSALVQSLRQELDEAKELASSESEQRKIFQNMVRDSAQSQVRMDISYAPYELQMCIDSYFTAPRRALNRVKQRPSLLN